MALYHDIKYIFAEIILTFIIQRDKKQGNNTLYSRVINLELKKLMS
jgi:hypothetical protein